MTWPAESKINILFRGRQTLHDQVWVSQPSSFLLTVYHPKAFPQDLTAVLSAVHPGLRYIDDMVIGEVSGEVSGEDTIELSLVYEAPSILHKEKIFRIRCTKTTPLSKVFREFCNFCGFDAGLPNIKNEVRFSFDAGAECGKQFEIDTPMTIAQLELEKDIEWTEYDLINVCFSEHFKKLLKLALDLETTDLALNRNVQRVFSQNNLEVREQIIRICKPRSLKNGQITEFNMKQLITSTFSKKVKENFHTNISKVHTGDDIIELFLGSFTYDITRQPFMRDTLFGDEYVSYSRKVNAVVLSS